MQCTEKSQVQNVRLGTTILGKNIPLVWQSQVNAKDLKPLIRRPNRLTNN